MNAMTNRIDTDVVMAEPQSESIDVSRLEGELTGLIQDSRFEEAICLLNSAICENESPELWNDWATVQHAAGKPAEAEKGFRRAITLAPTNRDASVNLGLFLLAQGRYDEATQILSCHLHNLSDEENTAIKNFELKRLQLIDLQPECSHSAQVQQSDISAEERIHKLESALEYLLISNLNAKASRATGAASNRLLIDRFLGLVRSIQPQLFLDIGANDASTACRVKAMLPTCEVWAFEANPEIHGRFASVVTSVGVNYVNLAISSATGKVTLYAPKTLSRTIVNGEVVDFASVEPEISGKTSMRKRNENATYREFSVDAISLNDFMAAKWSDGMLERNAALWIDVEGAAFEVLTGGEDALKRAAVILIEAENYEFWSGQKQAADVAKLIISAGFIPLDRDREYGDKQFNTLFIHHSFAHLIYSENYVLGPVNATAAPPARKLTHRTLGAHLTAQVPVFIPVFNNPTYVANTLQQLSDIGMRNVCLVDNDSTSHVMRAFLELVQDKVSVIRTGQNKGPRQIVECPEYYDLLPDLFCITDPDLEFNAELPEDFLANLIRLTNELKVGKAGFALKIDDSHLMHAGTFEINRKTYHPTEWEQQYWETRVGILKDGSPVYKAGLGTTFAVYNKKFFNPNTFVDAVRVGGRYACRHLPWYRESIVGQEERAFYGATHKHARCGVV
ncbi:FkbM family methyltransferase [Granulicella aggregans]|uniref:FkbM family methyltransferase n=1 Tax=Granulicella aggregans TaxID=474949 RepID=UPI0021E00AC9|nr:FkbM family methyltransferase [Granulicella aggregans]